MMQRLSGLRRTKGTSSAEFSRHWREVHGPLAAKIPGLVRYQQNHVVDTSQRVRHARVGAEVDGFSQLWFSDAAAMKEASNSPEYRAAFGDLETFVDAMSQFAVETNPVMEPCFNGTGAKRMTFLYAKDGVSLEKFRSRWFDEHAEMVASFPEIRGYLQHMVTDYLKLPNGSVAEAGIRCAGILEMWFDDVDAMELGFKSPEATRTIAHGDLFLGGATTYLVEEVRFI